MSIDPARDFIPLNFALLTISDTRNISNDESGNLLQEKIQNQAHRLLERSICHDDKQEISAFIEQQLHHDDIHVIITTGGTGITARDITPEVLSAYFDKDIPGFGELFRYISYGKIGTSTIQSRALAGVARKKLIFALPGSPSACRDAWDEILCHQLDNRFRPCNFVQLLPKL